MNDQALHSLLPIRLGCVIWSVHRWDRRGGDGGDDDEKVLCFEDHHQNPLVAHWQRSDDGGAGDDDGDDDHARQCAIGVLCHLKKESLCQYVRAACAKTESFDPLEKVTV